jgi:hypothetical protein
MNLVGKIATSVMIVLMVISVGLILLGYYEGSVKATEDNSWNEIALIFTVAVFGIAIIGVLVAEIMAAMSDVKSVVRGIIVLVGVVALIGICYAMADTTPLNMVGYEGNQNTESWLAIADTGMFLAYIFFAVAALSILVTEVYNRLK